MRSVCAKRAATDRGWRIVRSHGVPEAQRFPHLVGDGVFVADRRVEVAMTKLLILCLIGVALAVLACTTSLPFGSPARPSAACSTVVPLLQVGSPLSNPPAPAERIRCCGDAKQYSVAQNTNDVAVEIAFQAVSIAADGGPITGLRLGVAIVHCESDGPRDCAPIAEQTTPNIAAGRNQPPYPLSQAYPSVSGRNIRLIVTVTNDQDAPGAFRLSIGSVTPGPPCVTPF